MIQFNIQPEKRPLALIAISSITLGAIVLTTSIAKGGPTTLAPLPAKADSGNQTVTSQPEQAKNIWVKPEISRDQEGRITIAPSEFSIIPPDEWVVRENVPGQSLVLEAPPTSDDNYRGTLQVRMATGPRFLDPVGIDDFKNELQEKLANEGGTLPDFTVRNSEIVTLDDSREALLVYTSFTFNQVEILQAHLLLSNEDNHAVVTYTDLEKRFESNAEGSPLATAWTAMTSANLPGTTPSRFAGSIQLAALAGVLLVLGGILLSIRNSLARQSYSRAANSGVEDLANQPLSHQGLFSASENMPSGLSDQMPLSSEDLLESDTIETDHTSNSKQAA